MRKYQQIILSVILTVILLGLAYWAGRDQPVVETVSVVIVTRDVAAGNQLSAEDLGLLELSKTSARDNYLQDLNAAASWWTSESLEAGEILLTGKLTQTPSGIAYPNPGADRRLMTIELAPGAANGFYLAPGNRIDLILVPRQNAEGLEPTLTIQGIVVVDVIGAKDQGSGFLSTGSPSSALVCLDVSRLQAQQIAEAKSRADIQIAVINESFDTP